MSSCGRLYSTRAESSQRSLGPWNCLVIVHQCSAYPLAVTPRGKEAAVCVCVCVRGRLCVCVWLCVCEGAAVCVDILKHVI